MLQRLAFVKGSKSRCCTPAIVSFDVKAMSFNYSICGVGVLGCAQVISAGRTLVSHSPMRSSISLPLCQLLRGLTGTYLDGGLASSTTVAALS